jgi:leucyl-tRNA synthetase
MPVDWYNGGMEHTTLHLLYSRFIYKFLWDIGAVPKMLGPEPYKKRTSHGMILGEGSVKMSKSKGNVVNPDEIAKDFGADTLRVYEMFMGPFEQMIPWDTKGVKGSKRFLEKVWVLGQKAIEEKNKKTSPILLKALHKIIKKATDDIEELKFNTVISSLMEFVNIWSSDNNTLAKEDLKGFLIILSSFAPFISEELWEEAKFKNLCCETTWPKYDASLVREEKINLIIQINGKVRDKAEVDSGITEEEAKKVALEQEKIKSWLINKEIKKIIYVKNKLINIVI